MFSLMRVLILVAIMSIIYDSSFLNISSIRYETANPPTTLIAATAIEVQASTFVGDPDGSLAIKIPPNITTPDRLLLVLIKGENRAGSTDEIK